MHRFHLPDCPFNQTITISKTTFSDLWHQLKNVLRIEVNDELILFGNDLHEYTYRIVQIEKVNFTMALVEQNVVQTELPFDLILAQALPQKAEKWEWLLQKGSELGVCTFIPLITSRTQRKVLPKDERMHRIIVEAIEQSGRVKLPELQTPRTLETIGYTDHLVLFASLLATAPLHTIINHHLPLRKVIVVVGPEGGFSKEEETYLLARGAIPYSLGKRVLRLETAALVSLGILASTSP